MSALPQPRTTLLSWDGRWGSGEGVSVSPSAADAVHTIARHLAAAYAERVWEESVDYRPNIHGVGASVAAHLAETNPAAWERFKGDAVFLLRCLCGSGEKGLPVGSPRDSRAYFMAMHDFAQDQRQL